MSTFSLTISFAADASFSASSDDFHYRNDLFAWHEFCGAADLFLFSFLKRLPLPSVAVDTDFVCDEFRTIRVDTPTIRRRCHSRNNGSLTGQPRRLDRGRDRLMGATGLVLPYPWRDPTSDKIVAPCFSVVADWPRYNPPILSDAPITFRLTAGLRRRTRCANRCPQ